MGFNSGFKGLIKLHQNTILKFMLVCYNYCEFVDIDMVFMLFAISLVTVPAPASVIKPAGDSFPNTEKMFCLSKH